MSAAQVEGEAADVTDALVQALNECSMIRERRFIIATEPSGLYRDF